MGKAAVEYSELRFVFAEHWTEVYIFARALGDCPIGVQGWHHKEFYPGETADSILHRMFFGGDDPILWPLKSPDEKK